ncbi:pyridoxamine 5'-phosphate oxidase family protein [Streptacidiphilus monticola]|jgi:hypothetical protein|uniref:Pyridoxamine 5'-phosphate oxidase family protein n=1 Tax=Streptacidiphilus monticola TaxID=2161674 RepID=A0ABW1FTE9_9ACTN
MRETAAELQELQELLDRSLAGSTGHLRSIISPARTLTARQLTRVLEGMCTLTLATVTASGEPRVSGVDGHFLHGAWIFGTARTAAKARHLAARPAASASHLRGEALGVFVHGRAEELNPLTGPVDPAWPETLAHLQAHYGADLFDWEREVVYYRLRPHWMTVFAPDADALLPPAGA